MTADAIAALMVREALPPAFRDTVDRLARPLAARIVREHGRLGRAMVVGLCGGQGTGKSTIALFLEALLQAEGLGIARLSLDDLYLPKDVREAFAAAHHPLFATRGPPGTHDAALGERLLDALTARAPPHEVVLPRFDKALDARLDEAHSPHVRAPVDVVLFEGWFVGARPEPAEALDAPINALERREDPDGRWRRRANAELADSYRRLFARIDLLVLLAPPDFEQVYAWRGLQEEKLAKRLTAESRHGATMDKAALARFIQHYERLTRWILKEMPARANVVARLGPDHQVIEVRGL